MIVSHWNHKKAAFLGDSITDSIHVGTAKNYWQYLQEELGIEPLVYGKNGAPWGGIPDQVKQLSSEQGSDLDAIFIFAGTNDFNGNVPLGEWFTYQQKTVNANGVNSVRLHRVPVTEPGTLCGAINLAMGRIKEEFPVQQIILMTPIHRAFARFAENNVQPDENYANGLGLFVEDYVETIRKAADLWACPLIDLYRDSGLYPLTPSHSRYFHDPETDLLHPNAEGHRRIAETMIRQLNALPASFRPA